MRCIHPVDCILVKLLSRVGYLVICQLRGNIDPKMRAAARRFGLNAPSPGQVYPPPAIHKRLMPTITSPVHRVTSLCFRLSMSV